MSFVGNSCANTATTCSKSTISKSFIAMLFLFYAGISLAVEQGQIVSLLGANGAGKSTTLKVDFRLAAA